MYKYHWGKLIAAVVVEIKMVTIYVFVTKLSILLVSFQKFYNTICHMGILTIAIQIKYGLPYCVTCPSMSTDPGSLNPGMRRSRIPGWWDPGIRTNTGAGDTVLKTYLICIIAQVLENCFHTPYWHSVSEGGGVNSSWKWRPVIMSPAHNPLLLQLPILLHSMTPADI